MDRTLRNDELSSTPFSHGPDTVQKLHAKESKTGKNDVEIEAVDEGAE